MLAQLLHRRLFHRIIPLPMCRFRYLLAERSRASYVNHKHIVRSFTVALIAQLRLRTDSCDDARIMTFIVDGIV
jgi:hypothetical protein